MTFGTKIAASLIAFLHFSPVAEAVGRGIENKLFLEETVFNNRKFLRRPSNLNGSVSTPRKLLDAERNGQWDKLIVGVLVENYSKYVLSDASTSGPASYTCANRRIHNASDIRPGSAEFFAVDNDGWDNYGLCGAFSWQIKNPDGKTKRVSTL